MNDSTNATTEYGVMRTDGIVYEGMTEEAARDMAKNTGWTVVTRTVTAWTAE